MSLHDGTFIYIILSLNQKYSLKYYELRFFGFIYSNNPLAFLAEQIEWEGVSQSQLMDNANDGRCGGGNRPQKPKLEWY